MAPIPEGQAQAWCSSKPCSAPQHVCIISRKSRKLHVPCAHEVPGRAQG